MRRALALVVVLFLSVPGFSQTLPAQGIPVPVPLPLFPPTNWWNVDISNAPVDPSSATLISNMGGTGRHVRADWGGDVGNGTLYGFPYILVDGNQTKVAVDFNTYGYPAESDGAGSPFYPIPPSAITNYGWIEGGQAGNDTTAGPNLNDRHVLIVDVTHNYLYELWNVFYDSVQSKWEAGSGAFWDMNTNNQRPDTWTSADAAGLQILPGLVRYDEVYGPNEINHAFRVTLPNAAQTYVFPALHAGSNLTGFQYGMRLRLKPATDISTFPADVQKICRAMMKYGVIFADQSTSSYLYVSGSYDNRWNMSPINSPTTGLQKLTTADFEVVQLGWNPSISLAITGPAVAGSGDNTPLTVTAYSATFSAADHHMTYAVATGYRGTIHFTTTDGSATMPSPDYTFTPADNGVHTFNSVFRTAGGQTVYATDTGDPTKTGSHNVIVGPSTPTGLVATATTATNVALSWNPVAGAAQYEVYKLSSTAPYSPLLTTASTSANDTAATANNAYVYKVRAIDASSRNSPFSTPDQAITMTFTDDPAVAASTTIKAMHVTELRTAVNLLRLTAGLGATTFTDALAAGTIARTYHIQELRTSLDQARSALGLAALSYTDPALTVGVTAIKAAHVQELRNGVK